MGNTYDGEGAADELPVHEVYVSAFYMNQYLVTWDLWYEVYTWALDNEYDFDNPGFGKAADHPVQDVSWYDVVKWCNARSEKERRVPAYYVDPSHSTVYRTGQLDVESAWVKWDAGYRLPTEAEWEKAARGGLDGNRFPWGDTIDQSQANYRSSSTYAYDINPTQGYHPEFQADGLPYTSPVSYFMPNDYGLYDMAGNLSEWCWDWKSDTYYSQSPHLNPRGPASGMSRVIRNGGWLSPAFSCRTSYRNQAWPEAAAYFGFRSVLAPGH